MYFAPYTLRLRVLVLAGTIVCCPSVTTAEILVYSLGLYDAYGQGHFAPTLSKRIEASQDCGDISTTLWEDVNRATSELLQCQTRNNARFTADVEICGKTTWTMFQNCIPIQESICKKKRLWNSERGRMPHYFNACSGRKAGTEK